MSFDHVVLLCQPVCSLYCQHTDGNFGFRTHAASSSVQLHTLETHDTGLSRMLLWWTWKMGMPAVNDVFYPGATTKSAAKLGEGAAAVKAVVTHQGD